MQEGQRRGAVVWWLRVGVFGVMVVVRGRMEGVVVEGCAVVDMSG